MENHKMTNSSNGEKQVQQTHERIKVKTNEKRFDQIISEVEDYAIILLDVNGKVITWNKGAERIKHYQSNEIIGKSFRLFYTKDDKEAGRPDMLLQHAKDQGKAHDEGWRIRKDGTRFWGSVTLTALHDDDGAIIAILKVTRDLTERKATEDRYANFTEELKLKNKELQLSEERYHKMISEVTDYAIILLDSEGKVLDWNKGAEKLKGYSASEIVGKNFRLFYTLEDKERSVPERILQEVRSKGSVSTEGWRVKKNGTRFWGSVTLTALHNDQAEIIGFSKVTKDLTDKKIAEDQVSNFTEELRQTNRELKLSEERFHRMITEVQDYAILLLDKNGLVQNWNAGAAILKGYSSDEIVGRSFKTFYLAEDVKDGLPDRLLQEAVTKGRAAQEGWRVRKDGVKFWACVVITALHNDQGELIGFSKVTRDLTDKKTAEDAMLAKTIELQATNKILENLNKELSSFAYIVSHDLKEPVRKIQVFSGRQMEPGKSSEQILEYAGKIERTAGRMQKLMDDLLHFSEMTSPNGFEKVNLNEVLDIVKSDLEVAINDAQASIYSESLPIIDGVSHQLRQVFLNLLANSLKFRKPTEKLNIKITTRVVKGREVLEDPNILEMSFNEITFSDNGIGFNSEYAKKIFDVFYKLHPKDEVAGSGIGLAVVSKVLANHSGFIIAEGAPDKGAKFRIFLPE